MKIAIPSRENRVSPVLDSAENFIVIDVENNGAVSKDSTTLVAMNLWHRVGQIAKLGLDVLICGSVTQSLLENLSVTKVKIIPNVCGDVDTILNDYLAGKDIRKTFKMPGRN